MQGTFNKGESVRLVTGGPAMVVSRGDGLENLVCMWFVGTELRRDSFPIAGLVRCPPESVSP